MRLWQSVKLSLIFFAGKLTKVDMLIKPPVTVISALSSLEGQPDFEVVCKWLSDSLNDIRAINDSTKDEVQSRWNQGASQVLAEFLQKKQSARDTLYKMK
jgi:hypothetical protein